MIVMRKVTTNNITLHQQLNNPMLLEALILELLLVARGGMHTLCNRLLMCTKKALVVFLPKMPHEKKFPINIFSL